METETEERTRPSVNKEGGMNDGKNHTTDIALLGLRMDKLEKSIDDVFSELREWRREMEARTRSLEKFQIECMAEQRKDDEENVTWKWIREKFTAPLLTALLIWIAFDLLPRLFELFGIH